MNLSLMERERESKRGRRGEINREKGGRDRQTDRENREEGEREVRGKKRGETDSE